MNPPTVNPKGRSVYPSQGHWGEPGWPPTPFRADTQGRPTPCRGARGTTGRVGSRGFSLLEMVVALGLLGLVLTLIYGSFFQISQGTASINEQLSERQELRLLMKIITDDLQAARHFASFAGKEGAHSGIVAEREFLTGENFSQVNFHAAVPARFHRKVPSWGDPEMHEVGYRAEIAESDPGQVNLIRREDFFLDDDLENGGITVVLARGISKFTVSFLAQPGTGGAETENWEDSWDSSRLPAGKKMPLAIRVTLGHTRKKGPPLEETMEVNLLASMKIGS